MMYLMQQQLQEDYEVLKISNLKEPQCIGKVYGYYYQSIKTHKHKTCLANCNCKSLLLPRPIVASSPPFSLLFHCDFYLLITTNKSYGCWFKFLVEASHHRQMGQRSKRLAQCLSPPFQVIVFYTKTPRPLDSLNIGSKQQLWSYASILCQQSNNFTAPSPLLILLMLGWWLFSSETDGLDFDGGNRRHQWWCSMDPVASVQWIRGRRTWRCQWSIDRSTIWIDR
jgi:hypothetical protein